MKTLYLLRHAKSSWKDMSLSDFDRPLNKRGKRDAPFMAQTLKEMGERPDIIISSPAKRAKKTAKIFAKTLGVPLKLDERLYEAHPSDFHTVINEAFATHNNIMLVSHNPGLTMFNDEISDKPIWNIPTTGLVAVDFKQAHTKGKQRFFIFPKQFQ
ncbi:MAG: histidine phosphatase family protein [Sulfurovum sp.]|nr:histidine phosphatase family protein [Sulfurovum sp.]